MFNISIQTNYDSELLKLAHYQKFPQMLPFIGKYYDKTKLLLLGESHYLEQNSIIQKNDIKWYNSNVLSLTNNEIERSNTRKLINGYVTGTKKSKAFSIWVNSEKAIKERIKISGFILQDQKVYNHLAYYNFFQRPAEDAGGSIKATKIDVDKANETLKHVIKVMKPNFIMFMSSKSWYKLSSNFKELYPEIKFGTTPHPGCPWWHRKSKQNLTGKEKFISFLSENSIF